MIEEIQILLSCFIFISLSIINFMLETAKSFIGFVNENLLGIIFLIWAIITIKKVIHNHDIKKKYKRDNNKYEVKRNKDDGDKKNRNAIYLIRKEKNSKGEIVWHHIINMYTLVDLGYAPPSREDNYCFSLSEKGKSYILGENIIIHNVTFDFRKIDK